MKYSFDLNEMYQKAYKCHIDINYEKIIHIKIRKRDHNDQIIKKQQRYSEQIDRNRQLSCHSFKTKKIATSH